MSSTIGSSITGSTILTPQQQAIVAHQYGPALVYAVAGAGKTTAIVYRVKRLIEERVFDPREILVTTYNTAAARTLTERIRAVCGGVPVEARTLHSLGFQVLKRAREWQLLDHTQPFGDQKIEHNDKALAWRALALARDRGIGSGRELANFDQKDFLRYVETCKGNLAYANLEAVGLPADTLAVQALRPRLSPHYLDLYRIYEQCRQEEGLITFDDQLLTAWELLVKQPNLRDEYCGRYRCVIVDEFQDVNKVQSELLDLLTAPERNYMAVGDDDQTIYEWRGASTQFILDFAARYQATCYEMTENFRCRAGAVVLANQCIARNPVRRAKRMGLTRGFGGVTEIKGCNGETAAAHDMVAKIQARLKAGVAYEQIRILVRAYAQTPPIEMALTRAGIPYQVLQEAPFFLRPVVQDLLGYCRVARTDARLGAGVSVAKDELARTGDVWMRVYCHPYRKLSKQFAEDVKRAVIGHTAEGATFAGAIRRLVNRPGGANLPTKEAFKLAEVLEWLAGAWTGDTLITGKADAALLELDQRIDYRAELTRNAVGQEGYDQAQTVDALIDLAGAFDSLPEFAQFIEDQTLAAPHTKSKEPEPGKIVIGSIHTAKGQEWTCVFLPACNEGVIPHPRSDNEAEERRLLYVALTRARDDLYVYYDTGRKPSPFLDPGPAQTTLQLLAGMQRVTLGDPRAWPPTEVLTMSFVPDQLGVSSYFCNQWWEQPGVGVSLPAQHRLAMAQRLAECYAVAEPLGLVRRFGCSDATVAYWRSLVGTFVDGWHVPGLAEELIGCLPEAERAAAKRMVQSMRARPAQPPVGPSPAAPRAPAAAIPAAPAQPAPAQPAPAQPAPAQPAPVCPAAPQPTSGPAPAPATASPSAAPPAALASSPVAQPAVGPQSPTPGRPSQAQPAYRVVPDRIDFRVGPLGQVYSARLRIQNHTAGWAPLEATSATPGIELHLDDDRVLPGAAAEVTVAWQTDQVPPYQLQPIGARYHLPDAAIMLHIGGETTVVPIVAEFTSVAPPQGAAWWRSTGAKVVVGALLGLALLLGLVYLLAAG